MGRFSGLIRRGALDPEMEKLKLPAPSNKARLWDMRVGKDPVEAVEPDR